MSVTSTNSAHWDLQLSLYEDLTTTVKNAGIIFSSHDEVDSSENALKFIVGTSCEIFGSRSKIVINQLIDELKILATPGGKKAQCDVTFRLDLEARALFQAKMLQLGASSDQSKIRRLVAISGLYETCKVKNDEKHARGEPVNFGGIPKDLIQNSPYWTLNS